MSLYQRGMSLKALLENPELLNPPRKLEESKDKEANLDFDANLFAGQSAFLGPQLWDKTYDESDLKLEFMDLDEFLTENSIAGGSPPQHSPPIVNQLPQGQPQSQQPPQNMLSELSSLLTQSTPGLRQLSPSMPSPPQLSPPICTPQLSPMHPMVNPNSLQNSPQHSPSLPSSAPNSPVHHPSPNVQENSEGLLVNSDGEDFDPRCRSFTADELRPQPVIKKSKKVFVPEDLKDDKYWARRKKNNIAARRSRDARRTKENQIAMRALFLERQAETLMIEVEKLKEENRDLRVRLNKYEPDVSTDC